jgi:hypothetical protein
MGEAFDQHLTGLWPDTHLHVSPLEIVLLKHPLHKLGSLPHLLYSLTHLAHSLHRAQSLVHPLTSLRATTGCAASLLRYFSSPVRLSSTNASASPRACAHRTNQHCLLQLHNHCCTVYHCCADLCC